MIEIIIAVAAVTVIGAVAGVGLSFASAAMAVPKNEKAEEIAAVLPGANCGACGFSGCAAYAEAIANGEAEAGLCTPGGADTAAKLSEILGVAVDTQKKFVYVGCRGCTVSSKLNYSGVKSCTAANMLYKGPSACSYGCIGLGDCISVCEFGGISIADGRAVIDTELCRGCGKCADVCPKGLISTVTPAKKRIAVIGCSNTDKGKAVKDVCANGCISCTKCVKECKFDAIAMENNLPVIDETKCLGCGKCAAVCPCNVIEVIKV